MSQPIFYGEHEASLDAKSRVSFPAKLRDLVPLEERDRFFLTLGLDGCLFLFTRSGFERVRQALAAKAPDPLASREARDFHRAVFSKAAMVEVDSQGRILLPQKLKQDAGIEKDIVFLGVADRVEVWDAKRRAANETSPEDYTRLWEQNSRT